MALLEKIVSDLKRSSPPQGAVLLVSQPKRGRFAQEFNVDVFLLEGSKKKVLCHLKVFEGRGPYREWVEVFGLRKEIFNTPLEEIILDSVCPHTGRLFVEYFEDKETARELSLGIPVALSRLGFEIAKRGFSWFKDWYFPEGLMEGGHKIQAEKAQKDRRKKHLGDLEKELERFLKSEAPSALKTKALERFKILSELWK